MYMLTVSISMGMAYKDSFIGKRSQQAAENCAKNKWVDPRLKRSTASEKLNQIKM